MKFIGAHVSAKGGVHQAIIRAKKIKATALAFFTKNNLQWHSPLLQPEIIKQFRINCKKYNYGSKQIISHASFLINLGHPNIEILKKSRISFFDEIKRCEQLGVLLLNFHPGSHIKKISINNCLSLISESINLALDKTQTVNLVIENTSGQGSNLGFRFEHLSEIISNIENKTRIGVCIDTCHAFTAGYDLRTKKDCDNTFNEFDKIIGFQYLKCVHLNDSKSEFKSYIDRHHSIGKGKIGYIPFRYIMKDKRFENIPLILETINSKIWTEEIAWLKNQQ